MEFSPIKKSKVYGTMDMPGDNVKQVSNRQIQYAVSHLWLRSFMEAQKHAYTHVYVYFTHRHTHTHEMKMEAKLGKQKQNSKAGFISKVSSLP